MAIASESRAAVTSVAGEVLEEHVSRRSILGKMSVASAALFAGLAGRAVPVALADNHCCTPASTNRCVGCGGTCFQCQGDCTNKSLWYCCEGQFVYECGECMKGGPGCFDGTKYCCSYIHVISNQCF